MDIQVMRFLRQLLLPVLALAGLALARSSSGDSVLVLLDPSLKREDFSVFFGDLESTYQSSLSFNTAYSWTLPQRRATN